MEETWNPDPINGQALLGEFPADPSFKGLAEAVEYCRGHARHSARSALFHLGRAWKLKDIDGEMALFRGITATEEAVTAVIRSVQRLKYVNATLLNPHRHNHKAAMDVFLQAILDALQQTGSAEVLKPTVRFPDGDPSQVPELLLRWQNPDGGEPLWWTSADGPLDVTFHDEKGEFDLRRELDAIEKKSTYESIQKQITETANRRNEILYAHPDGIPLVKPDTIESRLRGYGIFVKRVLLMLVLVDRYNEQQLLVHQFLEVYLSVVATVDKQVRKALAKA